MPIAYPFGLQTVIATSKSRSQPAAFRTSEPRRGFAYFQASGTDTPVFWDVIFRFRKCDAVNFIMWFTQDLDRGVLDFEMPITTEFGLLMHTCRFMPDALLDAREMADVFEYRAQIITRAQLIPADALTAWGGVFSGPIPPQSLSAGVAFSLNISTYFSAGLGPFTYSIASGSLPAGLSINQSTGIISGTPVAPGQLGSVVFQRSGAFFLRQYSNEVALSVQPPDPYFADVVLLVHGDGSTGASFFPDSSSFHHTPTVVGAPTTQPDAGAFRGSSISFSQGTANYVRYSASNFLDTDTQAFTIEFFVDLTSVADISNTPYIRLIRPDATNALDFGLNFGAAFTARELTTFQASAPNVFNRQHMAYSRGAGGGGWFINGIYYTPGPGGGVNYNFNTVDIGNFRSTSPMITGLISEVRITRGVVRYPGTASFTPPTASFPNY